MAVECRLARVTLTSTDRKLGAHVGPLEDVDTFSHVSLDHLSQCVVFGTAHLVGG